MSSVRPPRTEESATVARNESPIAGLKAEHQVILRVVRVLTGLMDHWEQTGAFAGAPLGKCVDFLRLFADACHHGKEEDLLFPVLEARGIPRDGGPIGVMLYEHQMGRRLTAEMAAAWPAAAAGDSEARRRFHGAARQYIDLITNHIFKEDNVLFNMGARVMSSEDRTELEARFCAVNCRVFEGRRREELQRIADELEVETANG
jgi:hemerythrin-like domain-containing protein